MHIVRRVLLVRRMRVCLCMFMYLLFMRVSADGSPLTHHTKRTGSECYDKRAEINPPAEHFSLSAYFAYVFYVPLYITGPTISFAAFISQVCGIAALCVCYSRMG